MDLVATLAAVTGCALLVWLSWGRLFPPGPSLPRSPLSLEGAMLKGSAAAPVVIVEFSDYMCPYCLKTESQVLPEITRQYVDTGRVQLAFRHHPIEELHPGATKAAEAALCAARDGKFWEMHEALFRDQKDMDELSLLGRARDLSLNEDRFKECLAGETAGQVRADVEEAVSLGLSGTPAFLVGRREPDGRVRVVSMLNGARPVGDFRTSIELALEAGTPGRGAAGVVAISGGMAVALWFGARRLRSQTRGTKRGGDR